MHAAKRAASATGTRVSAAPAAAASCPRRPVWAARIHACGSDAWRAVHAGTRRRRPTRHRRTRCARLTMRDQDMLLDALGVPAHVQLRHAAANRSSNQSTSEAPRRSRRLDNGPTSAPGPGPTAHAATCPHRRTPRPARIGCWLAHPRERIELGARDVLGGLLPAPREAVHVELPHGVPSSAMRQHGRAEAPPDPTGEARARRRPRGGGRPPALWSRGCRP